MFGFLVKLGASKGCPGFPDNSTFWNIVQSSIDQLLHLCNMIIRINHSVIEGGDVDRQWTGISILAELIMCIATEF